MYTDIRHVHLELTERCNAACPMCSRNLHGGIDHPRLRNAELTLDDIKTLLPPAFVYDLADVLACGNYGDPIVARDLLPIVHYLRDHSDCHICINTNGSLRTSDWWAELGRLLKRPGDSIKFGIDGLADTNAIYRRHTNFERIIQNAQSFMAAGGIAEWEYIVFRHNEHQVDEARQLANDLGFHTFRVKRTGRFYSTKGQRVLDHYPVFNRDGNFAYNIEPPLDPQYQNPAIINHAAVSERFGSFNTYLDSTEIICKVAAQRSIYVNAQGLIFPCCWTAQLHGNYLDDVLTLLAECGTDSIDGLQRSISDIVQGEFFRRIEAGWSHTRANGRLGICARTCGSEFDQFASTPMIEGATNGTPME